MEYYKAKANNPWARRRPGLFASLILIGLASTASADKSPFDWAQVRLDYVRQAKVEQLKNFCNRLHELAQNAATDELILASFDINQQYAHAKRAGTLSEPLQQQIKEFHDGFIRYYIEHYIAFYDILFIEKDGTVIYSIRKESDLNSNILKNESNNDPGGEALKNFLSQRETTEQFIDFQYYQASSEPAAFFIEPIMADGDLKGWIILQCAINKVNTIMSWTEDLGQTGETFLVNEKGYMLTESNFEGASTILEKRLDDKNIQAKFMEEQGHRTVTDYRGHTALSSFEVVQFMGTPWLVVAKMDRDEIITQHYIQHRRYYADKLKNYCQCTKTPEYRPCPELQSKRALRIDMDEFQRAERDERLHTFGVSTCTGFLATYPGKFAYLAHISPKDRVYGANETNLVGQMIKRIKSFDIYRYQRRNVSFYIVATHSNSLIPIVDKLVDEGFLLSQIHIFQNPGAISSSITCDNNDKMLVVTWKTGNSIAQGTSHIMEDAMNIGEVVRMIMQSDANPDSALSSSTKIPQETQTIPVPRENTSVRLAS